VPCPLGPFFGHHLRVSSADIMGETPKEKEVQRKLEMSLEDLIGERPKDKPERRATDFEGRRQRSVIEAESSRRPKSKSRSRSGHRRIRHRRHHRSAENGKSEGGPDSKPPEDGALGKTPPPVGTLPVRPGFPGHPPPWGYWPPPAVDMYGRPVHHPPPPGYMPWPHHYGHHMPPPGHPHFPHGAHHPPNGHGQPLGPHHPQAPAPKGTDRRGFQIRLNNVPPDLKAADLAEAFHEICQGNVESVDLLRDPKGKPTGEAVMIFETMADAQVAVQRYHGGDLNGKRLQVVYEGEVIHASAAL